MKAIVATAFALLLATPAVAQTPPNTAPNANETLRKPPKSPDDGPPARLCLLRSPDRCDQTAELIREPFQPGDVDLYLLDKPPAAATEPKTAPDPRPYN